MAIFPPGRVAALASLVLLALSGPAAARVISYAPLSNRASTPAVQRRTNRHALLIEQTGVQTFVGGGPSCVTCGYSSPSRLVLHDSLGEEEPRDVTPGGVDTGIDFAAAREEPGFPPVLLARTTAGLFAGENPTSQPRFLFSADGGTTWSVLPLPSAGVYFPWSTDIGGPFVRARDSAVRVGTASSPFLLALFESDTERVGLWDVFANGGVARRAFASSNSSLIGMDAEGRRALLSGAPLGSQTAGPGGGNPTPGLYVVNPDGSSQALFDTPANTYFRNGWITPDGRAYVEADAYGSSGLRHALLLVAGGARVEIAAAVNPSPTDLFGVPTADFSGAWVLQRGTGPTVLSLHTPAAGLVEAWRDVTRPEVEALHVGASGKRLLVQVHRPRPQVDQRVFKDPALAVWEVGKPAPAAYDELFVNEQTMKAFVHVDPDTVSSGEPFLFDSGSPSLVFIPGGPSGDAGGGADVIQEWGVVRGSLNQRLVIPGTARANGMNGSRWRTDLVLRNPDSNPVAVAVRFLSNPDAAPAVADAVVTLPGGAIVAENDVLSSLFQLESGAGALLLTPESGRSIEATSRTYTTTATGSYGMSVGAVDVFAGIGAGFSVSFAAGLLGSGFRTNVIATDVSGRGAQSTLTLSADTADPTAGAGSLSAPPWGQTQVSDLAAALGAPFWRTGSVLVTPRSGGTVVGVIAIDNATNDPMYFPPDIPATVVRTIPAIVHADGSHGAAYRSDLFLFNPANGVRTVRLLAKSWSSNEAEQTLMLTLLPRESKVIRDALLTAFGRTGVARLRFQTDGGADVSGGVRVTSRTYTSGPSGGSYGLLIPALNAFQSAAGGESLEILLPAGGSGFRTNLALVELTTSFVSGSPVSVRVEVFDELGVLRDRFETPLPLAGGVQIDDLFHGRGLGDGPPRGLIRISPSSGLVAAYATVIDNGTNDPMYVAAGLAARP
jgi:hypothetical protein